MLVFTSAAAATAQQFQLNYLPQFLIYDAAANPLTNLRVEDQQWGVLLDVAAAGLAEISRYMRFGVAASTVTMFRLANGHIAGRNITITVTQAAAAAIAYHTSSDNRGTHAFKYQTAALLAGQPHIFTDFTALFMPGLAAGDTVHVTYRNGHKQLFAPAELLELAALYQTSGAATNFILNNIDSYIREAIVTQAIAGAAYVSKVHVPG